MAQQMAWQETAFIASTQKSPEACSLGSRDKNGGSSRGEDGRRAKSCVGSELSAFEDQKQGSSDRAGERPIRLQREGGGPDVAGG